MEPDFIIKHIKIASLVSQGSHNLFETLIWPLGDKVTVDAILRTPISGPHSRRFARQKVEPLEKSSEARKKPRKRKDPKCLLCGNQIAPIPCDKNNSIFALTRRTFVEGHLPDGKEIKTVSLYGTCFSCVVAHIVTQIAFWRKQNRAELEERTDHVPSPE